MVQHADWHEKDCALPVMMSAYCHAQCILPCAVHPHLLVLASNSVSDGALLAVKTDPLKPLSNELLLSRAT